MKDEKYVKQILKYKRKWRRDLRRHLKEMNSSTINTGSRITSADLIRIAEERR
jgi:hypothetical protein